jgi:16S rRNA (uracil1498-N3)-methyltransferase
VDEERVGLLVAEKMRRVIARRREEDLVFLDEGEVHHLTRVLRLRQGDTFEAIVPPDTRCLCRLARKASDWIGVVLEVSTTTWESPLRICLAQALIKGDKFEWVLQKAVELGVAEFQPMLTHRTEISLTDRRQERKLSRWARILQEAVKQCGRTAVPLIHGPRPLPDVLAERTDQLSLCLDETGATPLESCLPESGSVESCVVFVGPEGGWDEVDRIRFEQSNVAAARLGPRVLRTETAAVAALSILQFRLGDLSAPPESFTVDYRPLTH